MPVALDPSDTTSLSQEKPDSQKTTLARWRGFSLYVFAIVIFLGAFLLFFVQLLLAKLMLPVFGGVPAVWTSCLLVYQSLLLAGYGLAHVLTSRLTARLQAHEHPLFSDDIACIVSWFGTNLAYTDHTQHERTLGIGSKSEPGDHGVFAR